jgi:hypothetical protein
MTSFACHAQKTIKPYSAPLTSRTPNTTRIEHSTGNTVNTEKAESRSRKQKAVTAQHLWSAGDLSPLSPFATCRDHNQCRDVCVLSLT